MRNIHIVSHTHWDREWYMPFQLFRLRLVHLVDGLLDLLEKDGNFKYFMLDGQTIILDDYLQMRPEKEAILRDHIRKGRILIGPWHILPDMFLVGPEAHIRNLQQGDRTARGFGSKMMIGYMPDSFGHIGQVPQILRGFGIEVASVWRGVMDGPAEFWWQSPDGSRVLMAYLRESYGNGADLPADNLERFASMLSSKGDALAEFSQVSDLLIMYGTDHMEPPPNTSKAIIFSDRTLRDTRVIHSTIPKYVAEIQAEIKRKKKELPVIKGELRACKRMHLLPGVLSSRMWIKQRNHSCETLLTRWVEPFSTWQERIATHAPLNLDHKAEILQQTWRLLMQNHPHDSICGCSVDQVHDEMKVRFDQVEQIGEELARQSLENLAACVDTQPENQAEKQLVESLDRRFVLVVFNPTSAIRTDVLEATLELPPDVEEFDLVDEHGTPLPYQQSQLGSHEIINVSLDGKGLRSMFANISDGRAAGMTVQDIKVRRSGADIFIDAIMAEGGEPNLKAWNLKRREIEESFKDPSIASYHVSARYSSATHLVFTVPDVPGLGYKTLWLCKRPSKGKNSIRLNPLVRLLLPLGRLPIIQKLAIRPRREKPPYIIENDIFSLEALKNGTFSIFEKRTNSMLRGLNQFLDGGDCGDEYNYSPPSDDLIVGTQFKRLSLHQGELRQTLKMDLDLICPCMLSPDRRSRSKERTTIHITTTATLSRGIPRVDIHTVIDNHANDHRLRVHFPAPFKTGSGSHDGHFEVVERNVGVPDFDDSWVEQPRPEVPQRAFTDVSDGHLGLMIANRGLPEVEVKKNTAGNSEIALTLLRCVSGLSRDDFSTRKGHAGPFQDTPGAQLPGVWEFDYSIIPHPAGWLNAFMHAYAFETPLRLACTGLHSGSLPVTGSFLQVEPSSFVISAVMQTQDASGWLARGYNITGGLIQVSLTPWRKFKRVELANLAEEKQADLKLDDAGRVTVPVGGHKIITVIFRN
jgi:mannosylglycerate hydrolase